MAYMQSIIINIIVNLAFVINLKNKKLISSFGKRIRKLREERDYSMRYLADLADVNYTQISKIETGKINTTISTAYAIAKALDISIDELFKFEIK
jgi:transcriptional regulator with XRE-family HTH domain